MSAPAERSLPAGLPRTTKPSSAAGEADHGIPTLRDGGPGQRAGSSVSGMEEDDARRRGLSPDRATQLQDLVSHSMDDFFAESRRQAGTPLTWREFESLADRDLDDRVCLRLSSLINYFDPSQIVAEDPDVAAYLATRVFEWEVGNGGLHQYFYNFPEPDHLSAVLSGYQRPSRSERRHRGDRRAPGRGGGGLAGVTAGWQGRDVLRVLSGEPTSRP